MNNWARIQFDSYGSNPLYYAHNLYVGDGEEPVKNLVIEGDQPISDYAFYNADCLMKVRVKDGAAVGIKAFYSCTNLNEICLDVSELNSNTFEECPEIKDIYVPLETPPTAPDDAFSQYTGVNLYVPDGSVSRYKNAEQCWWKFSYFNESDFEDLDVLFAPNYTNFGSGVEEIVPDNGSLPLVERPNDIYNLQGICIKRNATEEDVKALAPGLYIIAGKKVIVK